MLKFALAVLATWRLTHLLASEDGPADIIYRFRVLLGQGLAGKLMDCFNCLSLWISAPMALYFTHRPLDWWMYWLALSGGACLLESFARAPAEIQSAPDVAEGGNDHVLRRETLPVSGESSSEVRAEASTESSTEPIVR